MAEYIDKNELYQAIYPKGNEYAQAFAMRDTITRFDLLNFISSFPSSVTIDSLECEKIKGIHCETLSFSQIFECGAKMNKEVNK